MLEEGRCKDVLPELDLAVLRQVLGRLGRMVVQREQLDDRSDSSSGEQCWVLSSLQLQRSTARHDHARVCCEREQGTIVLVPPARYSLLLKYEI